MTLQHVAKAGCPFLLTARAGTTQMNSLTRSRPVMIWLTLTFRANRSTEVPTLSASSPALRSYFDSIPRNCGHGLGSLDPSLGSALFEAQVSQCLLNILAFSQLGS